MRIVNKQYSMESFISRLPGVYPAYKDGVLYYFDEASLNTRGYEYPTNYGMIPLNLVFNKVPSEIQSNDGVGIIQCDGQTTMSWELLSEWYSFFKRYYELLNDCGHCDRVYTSATEYYDTESKKKFPEELRYGSERETYEDFDNLFNERGGKVGSVTQDGITDIGFYGWINNNIISGASPCTITSSIVNPDNCDKLIPKIEDKINISVSIDDMGEFSIFSNEYLLGEEYTSGEAMFMNNKSMYISAGTGYNYDDVIKEMVLNDVDWADYTDKYIGEHPELFCNNFKYYGFKPNGEKVSGNTAEEVENALTEHYVTIPYSGICVNGEIIEITEDEYIEVNGKTYYVYREKDTETPYVYFNGKKTYANLIVPSFTYRFTIASSTDLARTKQAATLKKNHIKYDGGDYEVINNAVRIGDMVYDKVDGYFETEDNTMFVISGTNISSACTYSVMGLECDNTYVSTDCGATFTRKVEDPIVCETGLVTGYTSSKLEGLRSRNCLVDDIGTEINGLYDITEKTNYQPSEGEELDLLYQVGNTANIMPFSKTSGGTDLTVNYFIGDIITDMYFYYEDIGGNKTGASWSDSSLETIKSIIPDTGATLITENILCNITYYIGATLKRTSDTAFELYAEGNPGVKYTETVEFEKHNEEYHLKTESKKLTPSEEKEPENHSVSYPVVCYDIKKKDSVIDGGIKYIDNLAKFEARTLWISGTSATDIEIINYTDNNETEDKNGMTVFPVFRQEYMLGSATMQNVEADIYIDRGINAAIDKHLKLGEVLSMEALENYSNGYFKIMNN